MNIPLLAGVGLGSLTILLSPMPASAEPGRLLAAQCAQCHGTHGSGPGFEELAGKDIFHDLIEMKYRPVEGIMDRQARGYTDEQLRLISDYISNLPGSGND